MVGKPYCPTVCGNFIGKHFEALATFAKLDRGILRRSTKTKSETVGYQAYFDTRVLHWQGPQDV